MHILSRATSLGRILLPAFALLGLLALVIGLAAHSRASQPPSAAEREAYLPRDARVLEVSAPVYTRDGVRVEFGVKTLIRLRDEYRSDFARLVNQRQYIAPDGERYYPWEGRIGYAAMLDSLVRPVAIAAIRDEATRHKCADLTAAAGIERSSKRVADAFERDLGERLGRYDHVARRRNGAVVVEQVVRPRPVFEVRVLMGSASDCRA